MFWNIVIVAGLIAFWTHYIINHRKIREKIDGKNIKGFLKRYLM